MRVLDIDLDFFLADTCPLAAPGERPCLSGHEPWSADDVRSFLENKLGLNKLRPVPGRIFETHDGALVMWSRLIQDGKLDYPFEVTHIDAHSDLGIGYPGPSIVLNGALCQNMKTRCDLQRHYKLKQLDEANYLLYALAFRWVSLLENVRNPKSKPDMPREIVLERDEGGVPTALKLSPPLPAVFETMNGAEPTVAYREYPNAESYKASASFDFISLAVSPRYSPREADALIEVFEDYIRPI